LKNILCYNISLLKLSSCYAGFLPNVLSSALKEQRTETALDTGLRPMKKNVFARPLFILCFNSLTYSKTIKYLHIAVYDEKSGRLQTVYDLDEDIGELWTCSIAIK
jgi:hypothetical protein